jgi:uncharacterized protein (DUF2252 family)
MWFGWAGNLFAGRTDGRTSVVAADVIKWHTAALERSGDIMSVNRVRVEPSPTTTRSPDERRQAGVALRRDVPRSAHGGWAAPSDRVDPVEILINQGKDRIQELLPIRYGRMRTDPFAFLRGAAAVMAADLAHTPTTNIRIQASGDAHLNNFGSYATPEGSPVFDINDLDETLPAPFERDLKRLATSLVVAGRVVHYSEKAARKLALSAARSYREHITALARLPPVEAWNQRIDLRQAIAQVDEPKLRIAAEKHLARVLESGSQHFDLVEEKNGRLRIREKPPLVYHLSAHALPARNAFASYAQTLQEDRRVLLHRHALRDVAFKAVGVGSVGTFCAIGLLTAGDGSPLLLQIKEAQESVLAPFAGASEYSHHGERVVVGERMMQAATDIFLGWTREPIDGRHFYIRRLKDPRLADIGTKLEAALPFYASLCGRTLARAHARAGDAMMVSGYTGNGFVFEEAITDFAVVYADQTEKDWNRFLAAIKSGRIVAAAPEPKRT